jgi:4-aminobutyrate aminotransferase/(S)-3-amino-2-methylpropionate transaminase
MPTPGSLTQRRDAVVARGLTRIQPLATAVSARGAIIVDEAGREVIDFAGGIGVLNVGHCDPAVVEAVRQQAGRVIHTCFHVAVTEPYVALCEKLVALIPHGGPTKAMLVNSGAEAVENAVKIARQHTGRHAVLCFSEAFHGRTLMALTLTSKTAYKTGCGPFAPEVYRMRYPARHWYGDGLDEPAFVERELRALRAAFATQVSPSDIAAIIIEPVLGEGGFVPCPFDYLHGLRRLCDEHGIVLIVDEVQSGFCRTGRWAAFEHAGIVPDISTWAKSMGGGLPIGAILGKADVMDSARPGTLGGTFGGNPVSCAAALATIGQMERLDLNARAAQIGARVTERFRAIQRRVPGAIADIRGLGGMVAMELAPQPDGSRSGPLAARILAACFERGVLLVSAGVHSDVIRVLCPLVITDEQLDRGLTILEEETVRLASERPAPRPHAAATR